MTGANTPAPFAVTSEGTTYGGYSAWKAFDGISLVAANSWLVAGTTSAITLDYYVSTYTICGYKIFSLYGGSTAWTPKTFTFNGSNNNVDWTQLDSRVNQTWTTSEAKTYYFANTTPYRYYKLHITANNGDVYTGFNEMEMYERDTSDTTNRFNSIGDDGKLTIGYNTYQSVIVSTSNTIGIDVISPVEKLEVNGKVKASSYRYGPAPYTYGITTPTVAGVEFWNSDYSSKHISTGTTSAWDYRQIYP